MAQLKDTVVSGSLRATDTIYGDTGQFRIIKAPTSSNGTTYGPGSTHQILASNGTSTYWSAPIDSDGNNVANTYVKLRANNTISGDNTFSGSSTFTGPIIANSTSYSIANQAELRTAAGICYGICDTAQATQAKVVTLTTSSTFTLTTGTIIAIRFTYASAPSPMTLNINGTGAKKLYLYGTSLMNNSATTAGWSAGATVLFVYDATLDDNNGGWTRTFWHNTTEPNMVTSRAASTVYAETSANGGIGLMRYVLQMMTVNQKWSAIACNTATPTAATPATNKAKTAATANFLINSPILYTHSNIYVAPGNSGNVNGFTIASLNLRYSIGTTDADVSLTYQNPVYLVGIPNSDGCTFKLDPTQWWTQDPNNFTNKTERIFIYLGITYSTSSIYMAADHPIFCHNGTTLHPYIGSRIPNNIVANGLVSLIKTSTTPVANYIYFQNNAVATSTLMQVGVSADNKYQGILSKGYYNGTTYTASEKWIIARKGDGVVFTPDVFEIGFTGSTTNNSCIVRSSATAISLFANSNGYRGLWAFANTTDSGTVEAKYIVRVNGSNTVHYNAGYIDGSLLPNATSTYSLGNNNYKWKQIFVDDVGTITSGTWNGSIIDIAHGGTNASSAVGAKQNLGLGSADMDFGARNTYGSASHHWGIAGNVVSTDTVTRNYEQKRTNLIIKDNGLLLFNGTDNTNAWDFSVYANNIVISLYNTPKETDPGAIKKQFRLAYKEADNETVGNTNAPIYLNNTGSAAACTAVDVAHGGTGVTSFTANRIIVSNASSTTGALTTREILTASSVTHLNWGSSNNAIPDKAMLAYWNGRYSSGASNLQYCDRGRFGTIVTHNVFYGTSTPTATAGGDLWFKPIS